MHLTFKKATATEPNPNPTTTATSRQLQAPYTHGTANAWPGKYSSNGGKATSTQTLIVRIIMPAGMFLMSMLITRFWWAGFEGVQCAAVGLHGQGVKLRL